MMMNGWEKEGWNRVSGLPEVKGWMEAEQRSALGFELSARK
jgi:hypothetical protein